jgi:predicted O-linked N-acetylglucosamine transferase (SPINDLY family)
MSQGRNEPCACGSGKKFKHCCERKSENKSEVQFQSTPNQIEINKLTGLYASNRNAEAESINISLLEKYPYFGLGWKLLASCFDKQGKKSLNEWKQAISLLPNDISVHNGLAQSLGKEGFFDEAISISLNSLKIDPKNIIAYNYLGNLLNRTGKPGEALVSFKKAIEINPNYITPYQNMGGSLIMLGKIDEAVDSFHHALKLDPNSYVTHSNLLFSLCYSAKNTPQNNLKEALKFNETARINTQNKKFKKWNCENSPIKLKVGFVSGDLFNHSVGYFIEGLIKNIDLSKIELYAYTTQAKEDELTDRIKPYFAKWQKLSGLFSDAAQLIYQDNIHVLIDLSGHTSNNVLPLFACKPAPVQCTWLGLPTTTGIKEIDYIIGDPIATPMEDAAHFSEKIWQLPETYICLNKPDINLDVNALPVIKNNFITFGSFNNLTKVNDFTIKLWSDILKSVPNSKLLLKSRQLKDSGVIEITLNRFAEHGIELNRLILKGPTETREDHLITYHEVDIALDTFPYPGVTTSAEALWMGVPVLSMQGYHFLSRTANSIAYNAGLSDWIATDENNYIDKAVKFADNINQLSILRQVLRNQIKDSSLFNTSQFARHFENALWAMWEKSKNQE